MGFIGSYKKSKKLAKMQRQIAPQPTDVNSSADYASTLAIHLRTRGRFAKDERLMEEYLDFCYRDSANSDVIKQFNLTREDLRDFSEMIRREIPFHIDGWIKGHYMPLSSITYPEPLYFLAQTQKLDGWSDQETSLALSYYWSGDLPQGALIQLLRDFASGPPEGML